LRASAGVVAGKLARENLNTRQSLPQSNNSNCFVVNQLVDGSHANSDISDGLDVAETGPESRALKQLEQ
jgi:hypothetical protein